MLKEMLLAGCGGFVGTAGRYLVCRLTNGVWHGVFPLGTFTVNMVGCFLIGLLLGWFEHTKMVTTTQSLLLITGFCGGFTTFSAFADDMWRLCAKGDWIAFALYMLLSVVLGIGAVWGGRALIH